jgi:hypothetical protein
MLTIVCYGAPKVGAEPSMVVWLWKWFTGKAEGFDIIVPPADVPLVCGLVCVKLTTQEEEKKLTLVEPSFSCPALLSTYVEVHRYSLLDSLTQN